MVKQWIAVLMLLALAVSSPGVVGAEQAAEGAERKTMVIVVDTSGSMKSVREEVKGALQAFLDGLKPGWQVILVRFDVFAETLERADIFGQPDRERLKRRLAALQFVGPKTNFDEGLKGAQAALFQAGVMRGAEVVIFSDGLSDPTPGKAPVDLATLAQRIFPQQDGYGIYLLQVSPGVPPGQRSPTTQGNVTSMKVSRGHVPQVLAVIEQRAAAAPEVPAAVPPAPPPPEPSAPAPPPVAVTATIGPAPERAAGQWPPYALTALALALAGGGGYLGWAYLAGRLPWGQRGQPVSLQLYGRQDTLREFWLGEGESLRLGGGICDYPLPTPSNAILTRQHGALCVCPADPRSDLTLAGQPLQGRTVMPRDAVLVLDGQLYVAVHA